MKSVSQGISDSELRATINSSHPFIVECGAHDGRDTKRFLDLYKECYIVAFEPDPRPIERIAPPGFKKRIGQDNRVTLVQAAVSNTDGKSILYRSSGNPPRQDVTDWDHSSSLKRPTGHLTHSPWCTFPEDKQIYVWTVSLDSWFAPHRFDKLCIDLLWVDVQGGQQSLIAGARKTLEHVNAIYIECHKVPMYDTEPTQDELVSVMDDLGFRAVALYEGYNFLFVSKPSAICK